MALRALPPGLPPDVVEKLRWEAFGHKKAYRIDSQEAFLRFAQKRRFVLVRPIPGTHYPSVLEAAVGRPLLDFVWDERSRKLLSWRNQAVRSQVLVSTAVLAGQESLVAPLMLSDLLVARGQHEDLEDTERRCANHGVGPEVTWICREIAARGALPESELQGLLRSKSPAARHRLRRSLHEARAQLLIVETDFLATGEQEQDPVYELLPRAFPDESAKVSEVQAAAARQRIACRYLRNVLVESSHAMARVLGWSPEEALEACQTLVGKRMALCHPASRYNHHLFQAASTDLLVESLPSTNEGRNP